MTLMHLILTLVVVGIVLWVVNTQIPIDGKIKRIVNIVVLVAVLLWLFRVFGLLGHLETIHVSMVPSSGLR